MPTVRKQTRSPTNRAQTPSNKSRQSAWDRAEGVKVLLYGRSGTGKTTLWATFPGPILALISSGGNKPGELKSIDTPEYRDKINAIVVEDSATVSEEVKNASQYATIVVDHASGLQDLILKEILGLSEVPVQKSWGLATQQQYGQCTLQAKEHLRNVLNFDGNVVIVAQEREFNTDSTSDLIAPYVGAGLTPSLTGWLNTAVDYIVQTFIRQHEEVSTQKIQGKTVETRTKTRQVEYCLRTAPDPVYTTKFRLPKGRPLPDVIVDPSYDKILSLIQGE